jgi:hypothetical protein
MVIKAQKPSRKEKGGVPIPAPPAAWLQAGLALAVLGWRIMTQPAPVLWRDWGLILSAYWLLVALKPAWQNLSRVTASVGAYLLAIYVIGQFPHTLKSLGFLAP